MVSVEDAPASRLVAAIERAGALEWYRCGNGTRLDRVLLLRQPLAIHGATPDPGAPHTGSSRWLQGCDRMDSHRAPSQAESRWSQLGLVPGRAEKSPTGARSWGQTVRPLRFSPANDPTGANSRSTTSRVSSPSWKNASLVDAGSRGKARRSMPNRGMPKEWGGI
jgi:hypothetical protein